MTDDLRERLAKSSYEFTIAHQKRIGDLTAFVQPAWQDAHPIQKKFGYALADWFIANIKELQPHD